MASVPPFLRQDDERVEYALGAAGIGLWEYHLSAAGAAAGAEPAPVGHERRQMVGDELYRSIHADDLDTVKSAVARAVDARSDFVVEYRQRMADGTVRWRQLRGHVEVDADGEPAHVIGVTIDVTEQRTIERQLRMAQKMEAVGQLAGGIAHDFNNILTAILGHSELLMELLDDSSPAARAASRIREAGEMASRLTRQLLAFSQRQVLRPEVLQLNTVVARTRVLFGRLLGETIAVVTVLADDVWKVFADAGQIEQILLNLAINARDAMPQGGTLTIGTSNVEVDEISAAGQEGMRPGRYVVVAVSDTGIGMDRETQAHIFEPFFTTKGRGHGTGLGLATVYGIVKQSAGYIAVSSQVGKGTTFEVYLPAAPDTAEVSGERQVTPAVGGHETVLLVEDQQEVRNATHDMLARYGYTVLAASSGAEALDLAARQGGAIDLLLTDVVMGGMSGRELARRLAEVRPTVRVLYMSGYTDDAIVRHGVLAPGVAFLHKPFSPRALASKVREVLDAERAPAV